MTSVVLDGYTIDADTNFIGTDGLAYASDNILNDGTPNFPDAVFTLMLNELVNQLTNIGFTTTSTTSVSVGTGAKVFTLANDVSFVVGSLVKVTDASNISNYMIGTVSAYSTSTDSMTLQVTTSGGSGTIANWTVTAIGQQGASGTFDINGLTAITSVEGTDEAVFYDTSASANKKITAHNLATSAELILAMQIFS